jgi:hypothetical protein
MKKPIFRREREWFIRPIDDEVTTIIISNAVDPEPYKFLWSNRRKRISDLWLVTERDRKVLEPKFKNGNLKYEIWTRLGKGPIEKWTDPSSKLARVRRLVLLKGNKSVHV